MTLRVHIHKYWNQIIKKTYNIGYKHKKAGEARVVYIANKVQGIKCYQH